MFTVVIDEPGDVGLERVLADPSNGPTALLMAWMLLPSVMLSAFITLAHYDAVRRGHPRHQQSRIAREIG
jgi:hypothetical protein